MALAVAYALSSTGQASPGSGDPGSPAEPLDVAAGIAGPSTLGDAQALPALVHKPKPKPPKEEEEPADEPAVPVESGPVIQAPTQSAPTTTTPPSNPTPPQVFSDSG